MSLVAVSLFFTAGGIASYAVHYFSREQKLIRKFSSLPSWLIQEAPPGQEVRIMGLVQSGGEEFVSPFTKRRCVYYEAIVEEQTDGSTWTEILKEVKATTFIVEDKSSRALIKSDNLMVEAQKDGELTSGFMEDASVHLEEFLARHGQKSEGKIFNRSLRYREGMLEPGESIAVLGRIRWEHDPDPLQAGQGYRDVPKRAVLEPLAEGQVWVSDVLEIVIPVD